MKIGADKIARRYPNGATVEIVAYKSQPEHILSSSKGTVLKTDDSGGIYIEISSGSIIRAVYGIDYVKRMIEGARR